MVGYDICTSNKHVRPPLALRRVDHYYITIVDNYKNNITSFSFGVPDADRSSSQMIQWSRSMGRICGIIEVGLGREKAGKGRRNDWKAGRGGARTLLYVNQVVVVVAGVGVSGGWRCCVLFCSLAVAVVFVLPSLNSKLLFPTLLCLFPFFFFFKFMIPQHFSPYLISCLFN